MQTNSPKQTQKPIDNYQLPKELAEGMKRASDSWQALADAMVNAPRSHSPRSAASMTP